MNEQALLGRITVNPKIFGGKPISAADGWRSSMFWGCSPLAIRRKRFGSAPVSCTRGGTLAMSASKLFGTKRQRTKEGINGLA